MAEETVNSDSQTALGSAPESKAPPVETALGSGEVVKPPETGTEAAVDPKKDEAPPAEVKYEFKDAPEGYDTKQLEAFAREHKLSPEAAQKVLEREKAVADSVQGDFAKKFEELTTKGWLEELKADKVLGGPKYEESRAQANRAWDTAPVELKKMVTDAKLQNNPIIFRLMHHFGARLKEDTFVGGTNTAAAIPVEQKFYGKK